ncbi:isoprenylcysteine carboxylmethyltransferase family protein [Streptomyces cyaneofuscatus]|uniref:methyltransferase family protein n=1 Tax=Streptomyces TaxID=1883 RepID=UPI002241F637|nr:isoprenylcysteine carboxylmethyltransferase family protein [Streptomyces sp. VB1]UZI28156.1 isoprenylcysteine carboxylmethyltransferase family protein [Streptomyces sp. VB1]
MDEWAWTALSMFGVWLLTAFGARTALQIRRTGDSGFRGLSGQPGSASWWAGVLFVVAILGGIAAPAAALGGLRPLLDSPAGLHAAGACLFAAGFGGTLAAQSGMGSSWRVGVDPDERTALVTSGVFSLVRNPIFAATIVTSTGLTLMVPNAIAVSSLFALIVAVELQVRVSEEPYLEATHGAAYREYGMKAGRFVPGIGRLRSKNGSEAADPLR